VSALIFDISVQPDSPTAGRPAVGRALVVLRMGSFRQNGARRITRQLRMGSFRQNGFIPPKRWAGAVGGLPDNPQ